jgi:hypothetical protein
MNAADQATIATVLRQALVSANLVVERADPECGNMVWSEVPAEGVLGKLLSVGWRVTLRDPEPKARVLPFELIRSVPQADVDAGSEPAA